jgi:hypothetical protein
MQGRGFYNKNAAIPAAGGALALPLLEQAALLINVDTGDRPPDWWSHFPRFLMTVRPGSRRS